MTKGRSYPLVPEAKLKAKSEMRKPVHSQGKSSTPWEESGNA